jgi:hypothetical protein
MLNRLITRLTLAALVVLVVAGTGATTAQAATTCSFANSVLNVRMTEHNDSAWLRTLDGTTIGVAGKYGPVACSGISPTRWNTGTVLVVDESDNVATPTGNDGDTTVRIQDPHTFAPGTVAEPFPGDAEIEFLVDTKAGDDTLAAEHSQTRIVAGNGGLSWTLDDDADVVGMPFDRVVLYGGDFVDSFNGQGGNGTGDPLSIAKEFSLHGGRGTDRLRGSDIPAGDTIDGGAGDDHVRGGLGDDTISGGAGDDEIDGEVGMDMVRFPETSAGVTVDLGETGPQATGAGTDTFTGVENVVGTPFADELSGSAAVNLLDGGDGDDTLEGAGAADELRGGAGSDAVSYAQAPTAVTVDLARTTQPTDGDRLNSIEDAIGSAFADTLTGNVVANRIVGGPGADTVAAGDGADRVEVRDGEGDRVSCGADSDTAISDRRTLDAVDGDCENVDALAEPTQPDQPTDPGQPDTTLSFSLSGAGRQRVLRQKAVHVKISCALEECATIATGAGRLRAVEASRLAATRLRLGPLRTRVGAGPERTLKLRLTRRQLVALRKALAAGQRPKVRVTVQAQDAAGNRVARTLRVTAKR